MVIIEGGAQKIDGGGIDQKVHNKLEKCWKKIEKNGIWPLRIIRHGE